LALRDDELDASAGREHPLCDSQTGDGYIHG
jgi:hypothetical protein